MNTSRSASPPAELNVRALTLDTKSMIQETYQDHLIPGKKYRVVQPFFDTKKSVHRVGETWVFQGYVPSGFGESTYIYIKDEEGIEGGFGIDWDSSENNLGLGNLRDFIQEAS